MSTTNLTCPDGTAKVTIDQGELISFRYNGQELIHQKGDPGWRNADTEMFPIIGPTASNNFVVSTPRGEAIQDQHGLLRELTYEQIQGNRQTAVYQKEYVKHTQVKNSKYPEKSEMEFVFWPYSFTFRKIFELDNSTLRICFEIESEKGMPYMLGYHPAFKLSGDRSELIKTTQKSLTVQDIMDVGSIALPVVNRNRIELVKPHGHSVLIETEGFGNFMLWTEVPNMICIEPITSYPYTGKKELGPDLFRLSQAKQAFKVSITPFG